MKNWDVATPIYLSEDDARITAIPLCSICKNIGVSRKCKVFGDRPAQYAEGEQYDCPYVKLNREAFSFSDFLKLYPDIVKQLEEKVNTD